MEKQILDYEIEIKEKSTEVTNFQEKELNYMKQLENLSSEKEDLIINARIAEKTLETNERLLQDLRNDKLTAEENFKKQKVEYQELYSEKCNLYSELLYVKEEKEKLILQIQNLKELEDRKIYYKTNCLKLDKLCGELSEENLSLKKNFNEFYSKLQEKDKKVEEYVCRKFLGWPSKLVLLYSLMDLLILG